MTTARRLALAVLFALLLTPASAHAMTDEQRLEAYAPIAAAAWDDTWCGPGTGHPVTVQLHATVEGWGWVAQGQIARDGQYVCEVRFKDGYGLDQSSLTDAEFCRVLVHEYGHLAGVEHTNDSGIMDHFASPAAAYAPCDTGIPATRPTASAAAAKSAPRCKLGTRRVWGRCR